MFNFVCPECDSTNIICKGIALVGMDFRATPSRWRVSELLNIQNISKLKCLDCTYESNNEWDFAGNDMDATKDAIEDMDNKTISDLEF